MKYILSLLFVIIGYSGYSQGGYFKPPYIGWPLDTSKYGVLLMDTTTNLGAWFNLNTEHFEINGDELRLKVASDSVFVMGDSLCAINNGDTLCVYQDSVYITNDSFCVIQMGDTTCVEFLGSGFSGLTIYNGDDTITSSRTVMVPAAMNLTIRRLGASASDVIKVENISSTDNLTIGANTNSTNKPILTLENVNGGTTANVYIKYQNVADHFSTGILKDSNEYIISKGSGIHDVTAQFMNFYGDGDSISVRKDIQINRGILDKDGDYGTSGQVLSTTGTEINWIDVASDSISISKLKPALSARTFNNTNYQQEWQWNTLAGGSGLKLTSTSTAAIGGTQKLFDVRLSGANATAGQTTYAGYFSNTHSGSTPTNFGIYSTATTGTINYALYGEGTGSFGYGVFGVGGYRGVVGSTSTGIGVQGAASSSGDGGNFSSSSGGGISASTNSGTGATISSTSGLAMTVSTNPSSTNTEVDIARFTRTTSGTAANGIGMAFPFYIEADNTTSYLVGSIAVNLQNADDANRTSQIKLTGVGTTTTNDLIYFEGDKRTRFNGRAQYLQGADVGVAATLVLGYDGNVFEMTGSGSISTISNLGWQNGSEITLMFSSTATVVDGTANSGTDIGLELGGNANFSATADDLITLVLGEIGGTQRWREKCRTAN